MHRKIYSYNHSGKGNINALKKMTVEEQKDALTEVSKYKLRLETALAKLSEASKQTPKFKDLQAKLQKIETLIVELETVLPASAMITPGFARIAAAGKDFIMGDTDQDDNPQHKVTFTYNFNVGQYDLTFAEYDLFCVETGRTKPSDLGWGRDERPVINVSCNDAIDYCNWRSEKEGLPKAFNEETKELLDEKGKPTADITKVNGYRLMTESEYEYVARGGKANWKYGTASGELKADEAVYSTDRTAEVDSKKPIIFDGQKIYNFCGNVWKWCLDWYADKFFKKDEEYTNPLNSKKSSSRVLRGGSWSNVDCKGLRSSYRISGYPGYRDIRNGFRLARTCPE